MHDVLVPHAEKCSNPQKQSGYPAEAYLAELHSGNVTVDINLTPGTKKCSCVAPRLDTVTETISDCTVA